MLVAVMSIGGKKIIVVAGEKARRKVVKIQQRGREDPWCVGGLGRSAQQRAS